MKIFYSIIFLLIFDNAKQLWAKPVQEIELNDQWTLRNQNGSIMINDVSLPSGIFSAYARSLGLPEDHILHSKNDIHWRWLAHDNWTYTKYFTIEQNIHDKINYINLVFYGIDTVSTIYLNGAEIGRTDNMFVRYTFEVLKSKLIREGSNTLEVKITSPIWEAKRRSSLYPYTPPECPPKGYNGECHMNLLRKMQASFGWDWGLAAPSMGIWKRVTVEYYDVAVIRDVDVKTMKIDDTQWRLDISIDLETKLDKSLYGELTFYAVDLLKNPKKFKFDESKKIENKTIKINVTINNKDLELWWPNGLGNQKLYHLHFTFNGGINHDGSDPRDLTLTQKSIRIGFRTIELVQDKMDNGLSFYFKVNGHPVFMRGTNYIPSHILPELGQNQERIRHLMESVRDANMNMIRVWGGGVYESDFLYDMADYYGILIWQDMMFGCAMYPVVDEFLQSVRMEVLQNIKRIGHHASVALIAGNNENEAALAQHWYDTRDEEERFRDEYRQMYNATINDELRKFYNHPSRIDPLTSSPSNGQKTIEDDFISRQPQDPNYGDIHFYEYAKDWSDPTIYPVPRFSSEYGFQALPSKSAWEKIKGPEDTLKDLINHRQHLPLGNSIQTCLIMKQFPLLIPDHPEYVENMIYFSQISQALATKTETEVYRKNRQGKQMTMGALYWQLNDVWIAPSWSSIDYNGNYKLLHYWAKQFMKPVSVIAHGVKNTNRVEVTVVNDEIKRTKARYNIVRNAYLYRRLAPAKHLVSKSIEMEPNSALLADTFELESDLDPKTYFYEILLEDYITSDVIAQTYYFPQPIKRSVGIQNPNLKHEILSSSYKEPITCVSIAIKIDYPALFVYIEIENSKITKYKLSENGFIQTEPIRVVYLEYNANLKVREEDIRIYTVNQYMDDSYPKITDASEIGCAD